MLTRGLTGSLLVLVGGLVVSTLPDSTPLLRITLLREIRDSGTGRALGLAVAVLGLGLLAAAWLALCRAVAGADGEDRGAGLALVRQATLVWSAPLLLAPPLFSRDGWSYAAQGMLVHVGISPYEHGPGMLTGPIVEAVDPRWMWTIAPYGPVPLELGGLAAGLTAEPWLLVVIHRVAALVGIALLAWAVPRLAAWTGAPPAPASAVAIASPLVLANGVGGLHNDLLMVGLMAAALVLAAERGWVAGAVLGGVAAAVKLPGGLVCIGVALLTLPVAAPLALRLRRLAAVGAVSTGLLVGLGLLSGLGVGWVQGLAVPGTITTPLSVTTLLGGTLDWTGSVLGTGSAPGAMVEAARRTGSVAAVGFIAWACLRRPTGDRVRAVEAVAAVMAVLVLLSPVVQLWYLLWPLPFLAALRLPRPATAALLSASVALGLAAAVDPAVHGGWRGLMLGAMVASVAVPAILVSRRVPAGPGPAAAERLRAA